MLVVHHDRGSLAAPVSGTLYEGRAARVHNTEDPLQYASGPEHRDYDELSRIASQLPGKPFTLTHPNGLLRDGAVGKVIGTVVAARVDGDHVVVTVMVSDQDGIDAINGGMYELSLGYSCKLDENRYQRDINVDHLALVPRARCGPTCALRADAEVEVECPCGGAKIEVELGSGSVEGETEDGCPCGGDGHETCTCKPRATYSGDMSAEKNTQLDDANAALDATRSELAAVKAELAAVKAELGSAKAEISTLKSAPDVTSALANLDAAKTAAEIEATNAKAALAAMTARAEKAEADLAAAQEQARKDADDAFNARVAARVELLTAAAAVGLKSEDGSALDITKMDDRSIKVAVIKHVDGLDIPADKVDAFVDGVFMGALDRHAKSGGSLAQARATVEQMREDGAPPSILDAEKAAMRQANDRTSKAWMTPSN